MNAVEWALGRGGLLEAVPRRPGAGRAGDTMHETTRPNDAGLPVAVVGGGLAGVTAAAFLRR